MRFIALAAAVLLTAAGCDDGPGGDGDSLAFDIDLVDDCPVATPFYLGSRSVEVQLRGDNDGSPCVVARRCIQVAIDMTWNPETIEAELRSAAQPLLSSDRAATDFLIFGSLETDCSLQDNDDVFLCGIAPLDSISGGVLEVPVDCAPNAIDLPACTIESLPDC